MWLLGISNHLSQTAGFVASVPLENTEMNGSIGGVYWKDVRTQAQVTMEI